MPRWDLQSILGQSFDPEISINSGQVFLWERHGGSWYGVCGDAIVKFSSKPPVAADSCSGATADFCSFPESRSIERKIFRLDDDIQEIFAEVSRDSFVRRLLRLYPGLRLMRQEPSQCLFSFICASNTNIPMIRRMLYALSRKFGQPVAADGLQFFTFPSARRINSAGIDELRACGLGYRAKAIKSAAERIVSGSLDLDMLASGAVSYAEAKAELLKVYGVGHKIADCVLLFSLEKLGAFPIDVWIARALARHYPDHMRLPSSVRKDGSSSYNNDRKSRRGTANSKEKLTQRQYELLSENARAYFGRYAGYAQQYLYYHMRHQAGKKW